MPRLVTVCHATLCQRLWGQHLSAGGRGDPHPTAEPCSPPPTRHTVETRAPPCWPSPHLAAAGTARSKLVLVAGHAVVSTLVGHEGTGAQWLLTAAAQEAVLVPRLASILQLPGPCGEQGSHSEAVCQAPECHPLLWPRSPGESPVSIAQAGWCPCTCSRAPTTHTVHANLPQTLDMLAMHMLGPHTLDMRVWHM